MLYKFPVLINIRGRSVDHNEQLTCVITVSSVPETGLQEGCLPCVILLSKTHCLSQRQFFTHKQYILRIIHCIIFTTSTRSLREGNVFSGVCLPASLSSLGGSPCTVSWRYSPPICTGHWPQPCSPLDMSKHVQLGPHCTETPRHIQTCSLWSIDCRKAGGWHSTEMPSCVGNCLNNEQYLALNHWRI